ncbi:MAG: T9SS type A sorting domain-containing protein [Bacteroidetes bacterium]|nr:T9SS type A sorting domain-containing protein [Bacteroidota bacterium]MBT5528421.1 T9SS type A sorting domain-containing protein [Cytophagia bacterium]MBT5992005.1 T9SS type A sorting domain-containing protein [Bacteroidota bacterium]MBT6837853.1 T9SS type A sorting domain-containing protein [Bacteroidota bacterium]MBT7996098.1 T9SS type A sorting domain-containing protein [Bacteroidota bacterium]
MESIASIGFYSNFIASTLNNFYFKKATFTAYILFFIGLCTTIAQESVTNGGEATGTGGTVSYSVGQVNYITSNGNGYSLAEGVQQAYEISNHIGIKEADGIELNMSVFPNPTLNVLTLHIQDYSIDKLHYQVFDMNGKLLFQNSINEVNSLISMDKLLASTYFIKVFDANQEIKSFKVIKH